MAFTRASIPRMSGLITSSYVRRPASARYLVILHPKPVAQHRVILQQLRQTPVTKRCASTEAQSAVEPPDYLGEGELKIFQIIKDALQPTKLEVQDISGGCGSMYALDIVSKQFQGLTVIKQHRLVNKILGEEIKKWHGVQLKTKAP